MIGISGSLIWSTIIMELIFNPCGQFRWSPEGSLSSPPLWCPWDLLRSFKVCSDDEESGVRKATGSYRTYLSPVKLEPWFMSWQRKTCQGQNWNWFLRFQWEIYPWAEHSDDDVEAVVLNLISSMDLFSIDQYFHESLQRNEGQVR